MPFVLKSNKASMHFRDPPTEDVDRRMRPIPTGERSGAAGSTDSDDKMVLLTRCCFGLRSLRQGCYSAAFFTLTVYMVLMLTSVYHAEPAANTSAELLALNLILLLFSLLCVVSSVVLILGLLTENRLLFLPYLTTVTLATFLEFVASFYFLADAFSNPKLIGLFAIDIVFCAVSVYCIVCVASQYQVYIARVGQCVNGQPIPVVRFEASPSEDMPSMAYQVPGGERQHLAVPTTRSSSSSRSHTDFSSMSDEATATTSEPSSQ